MNYVIYSVEPRMQKKELTYPTLSRETSSHSSLDSEYDTTIDGKSKGPSKLSPGKITLVKGLLPNPSSPSIMKPLPKLPHENISGSIKPPQKFSPKLPKQTPLKHSPLPKKTPPMLPLKKIPQNPLPTPPLKYSQKLPNNISLTLPRKELPPPKKRRPKLFPAITPPVPTPPKKLQTQSFLLQPKVNAISPIKEELDRLRNVKRVSSEKNEKSEKSVFSILKNIYSRPPTKKQSDPSNRFGYDKKDHTRNSKKKKKKFEVHGTPILPFVPVVRHDVKLTPYNENSRSTGKTKYRPKKPIGPVEVVQTSKYEYENFLASNYYYSAIYSMVSPTNINIPVNDRLEITCISDMAVNWKFVGKSDYIEDIETYTKDKKEYSLIITKISKIHQGEYYCISGDIRGTIIYDSCSVNVTGNKHILINRKKK